MNEVIIQVRFTRGSAKAVQVELYREGHGDDMVEQRADEMERVINAAARDQVAAGKGSFIKPIPPEHP